MTGTHIRTEGRNVLLLNKLDALVAAVGQRIHQHDVPGLAKKHAMRCLGSSDGEEGAVAGRAGRADGDVVDNFERVLAVKNNNTVCFSYSFIVILFTTLTASLIQPIKASLIGIAKIRRI